MKKATFYTLIRTKDGEKIAQEKTGYTFTEYGYTFNLYKIGSVWCVLEASTGLQVFQARTLKESPAKVSEYIATLNSFFSNIGEQTKSAIKIIADATSKAQAEKPEPTETEKKTTPASARNPKVFTKKRFYVSLRNAKKETKIEEVQGYAFTCEDRTLYTYKSKIAKVWYIVEPSTGMAFGNFYTSNKLKDIPALAKSFFEEYGSRFDSMIEKFSDCAEAIRNANGETATKEETKTEKPADVLETETEKAPIQDGEKPTETRANIGKVWKPCTMSNRAYYGKIYSDNMRRNDTRQPAGILPTDASASRVKSFLSPSDIHTLTSIGLTDKKPAMGLVRSDNGTRSGRKTDTNRQARNGETWRRGKVKPRGHPKSGITA